MLPQRAFCARRPASRGSSSASSKPRRPRARCDWRIAAAGEDDAPAAFGDWREFRARLVLQQQNSAQQRAVADENLQLLREQSPKLAAEGLWAHATATPERGGLLLATPDNAAVLGSERYWQAVVLLVQHGADGSVGLILNRPTGMVLRPGKGGLRYGIVGAPDGMQSVFGDNRVYCGGLVRQDVFHVLHGHNLEGAVQIVPGVFTGGEVAAVKAVHDGELRAEDFRFFCGAMIWQDDELQREIDRGAWWTAASSRAMVLKQCLQLPVPLWREVLGHMGGEYAATAAREAGPRD